jgi:hypothetical protein
MQNTLPVNPPFELKRPKGLLTPRAFVQAVLENGDLGSHPGLAQSFGVYDWSSEYAEPGYSSPACGILFGNWNDPGGQRNGKSKPERFAKIAEYAGYECEWHDEWSTCNDCNCAIRTSPNSYIWRMSYAIVKSDLLLCAECIRNSPDDYLAELTNNPNRADTLDIDLASFGFQPFNGQYENGLHPGQNDNPRIIFKQIRAQYPDADVVFQIPSVGQFDVQFTAWIRLSEQE